MRRGKEGEARVSSCSDRVMIAMCRNDWSEVPGVAQRPNYFGRLSPSAVTSQGQENGAGIVIPESVSLGPRLIPNKRGCNRLSSFICVVYLAGA
jgi:hypothetical protein